MTGTHKTSMRHKYPYQFVTILDIFILQKKYEHTDQLIIRLKYFCTNIPSMQQSAEHAKLLLKR